MSNPFSQPWSSTRGYLLGERVTEGADIYFCKNDTSVNQQPSINTAVWVKVLTPIQVDAVAAVTPTSSSVAKGLYSAPSIVPVGVGAGSVRAASLRRFQIHAQNLGITEIKISVGVMPTETLFHYALGPAPQPYSGGGGYVHIEDSSQEIFAISDAPGGLLAISESTAP
jgi:hypothetical protein